MSDQTKINDSNENEDMVDEIVDDFTMIPGEVVDEEFTEDEELEITEDGEMDNKVDDDFEKVVTDNSGKKPNFLTSFAAVISDTVIIAVLAYVLMYIADFILRKVFGYYIIEKSQMLFLLFIVVSLLYVSILEGRLGFTVGKTVFGIKVVRN